MRLKDIRKKYEDYTLTPIDIVKRIDPTKTGKYVDIIMRSIDEGINNRCFSDDVAYPDNVRGINRVILEIMYEYMSSSEGSGILKWIKDFDKYSKAGHIEDKDIQNYKTLENLVDAVTIVRDKLGDKQSPPKSETIYSDDDGWLVVKPLNFRASRKYGSNTKWCTTMIDRRSYFYEYSHTGILLYMMNTKTDVKWAVMYQYNELKTSTYGPQDVVSHDNGDGTGELSWWNVKDSRVDSYFVDIPTKMKDVVMDYILNEEGTNSHYFDEMTLQEWKDWDNRRSSSVEAIGGGELPPVVDIEMEGPVEVDEMIDDITHVSPEEDLTLGGNTNIQIPQHTTEQ